MAETPAACALSTFEWDSVVAWDELDLMGVLHHARFAIHVERAFTALLDQLGLHYDPDPAVNSDRRHAVASFAASFLAPVRSPGPVRVRLEVTRIGATSLTAHWLVTSPDGAIRHAQGERVVVHVGKDNRPEPWSDTLRSRLSPIGASA